jgi:hypothetical protein
MSCERYAGAIVDHACGADLAADAAAHLRACAACTALFDEQRRLVGNLDGELQAALAIEPSSQFAPRVRAAIESTPAQRRPSAMFWWTGLAAAAAAGIIVSTLPSAERVQPPATPAPTVVSRETAAVPRERVETTPPARSSRASTSTAVPAARTSPQRRDEPEVIVAEDQQRAVARFVALVRTGRLDTSSLAAQTDSEIAPPAELGVSPLAVSPIAIPSVEFGAHPVGNDGMPKE